MADISAEQLIDVRKFAVEKATEIASWKMAAPGVLANAAAIEVFILTGKSGVDAPATPAKKAAPTRAKQVRARK